MLSMVLRLTLQISILLLWFSCSPLPRSLPKDFQLTFVSSAVQPGASGNYSLIIKKTNNKDQYEMIRNYNSTLQVMKLNTLQVQGVYDNVRSAKIFRLKNSYSDMDILDGSTSTLTIQVSGKTKTIHMRNTQPKELHELFNHLKKLESELQ